MQPQSSSTPGQEIPQATYADLCRNPEFEGKTYSTVTFARLVHGVTDVSEVVSGLAEYERPILPSEVMVDSDMSLHQAFRGLTARCPNDILEKQQLVRVFYFGDEGKLHQGQVVIHESLVDDVRDLFHLIVKERIPIHTVIPVAARQFEFKNQWDDHRSMQMNNSSAFNFRNMITATGEFSKLSLHALGLAIDINPCWNPCYGDPVYANEGDSSTPSSAAGYSAMVPENGSYDLSHPGTLHNRHPIVQFMKSRGWTWGGDWAEPKDFHHFQKIPAELADEVSRIREQFKA